MKIVTSVTLVAVLALAVWGQQSQESTTGYYVVRFTLSKRNGGYISRTKR